MARADQLVATPAPRSPPPGRSLHTCPCAVFFPPTYLPASSSPCPTPRPPGAKYEPGRCPPQPHPALSATPAVGHLPRAPVSPERCGLPPPAPPPPCRWMEALLHGCQGKGRMLAVNIPKGSRKPQNPGSPGRAFADILDASLHI